jgi:hypothetical protein
MHKWATGPRLQIIVVEEEEGIWEGLVWSLVDAGFDVACANNVVQALGLRASGEFDIVVLDLPRDHALAPQLREAQRRPSPAGTLLLVILGKPLNFDATALPSESVRLFQGDPPTFAKLIPEVIAAVAGR